MSKIFDSHCHPNFSQYDSDREEVLARAKAEGVSMICIGTDLTTSKSSIKLAQQCDDMWATVGLHPNDNLDEQFDISAYRGLLKQPKVVAVGEIGLDYYRTDEAGQEKQKERFIQQLELAKEAGMPIVLHCRDGKTGSTGRAYPDMLDILKNYPSIRGVIHSCTTSLDEAKEFLNLGFYLGFNGILTFARTYDDIVRYAPLEQILLETDAPYLTPEPYRGKRNEPTYVVEVAKKVAELKNISIEEVIQRTTENCKQLFKI